MAITVTQSPPFGTSLHSPMWHTVTSSNSGNSDFRFVFDIYVGATFITRLKTVPDNGYGIVDVSRVIRSYVASYFRPSLTNGALVMETDDIAVAYDVQYGEEYTTAGISTIYTNLASGSYYGWNAYHLDTPTDGTPMQPLDSWRYHMLTERDVDIWMPRNGRAFISYLNAEVPEDHTINIQELDRYGYPHGSGAASNAMGVTGRLLVLNLNMDVMANAAWWNITPIIPAIADGYRFRIFRADGIGVTPWYNIRFLCEAKTPATCLHFLNRLGGFDTFYFSGPTRKELDVDRKTLQRIPMYVASNQVREYDPATNVYVETTIPFGVRHTNTRKLVSGYLSDADHNWLAQLVASPQIYLEEEGYCFPVTVKTAKWSQKLTAFDKMYNLELEIITGRQVQSQYR